MRWIIAVVAIAGLYSSISAEMSGGKIRVSMYDGASQCKSIDCAIQKKLMAPR